MAKLSSLTIVNGFFGWRTCAMDAHPAHPETKYQHIQHGSEDEFVVEIKVVFKAGRYHIQQSHAQKVGQVDEGKSHKGKPRHPAQRSAERNDKRDEHNHHIKTVASFEHTQHRTTCIVHKHLRTERVILRKHLL